MTYLCRFRGSFLAGRQCPGLQLAAAKFGSALFRESAALYLERWADVYNGTSPAVQPVLIHAGKGYSLCLGKRNMLESHHLAF